MTTPSSVPSTTPTLGGNADTPHDRTRRQPPTSGIATARRQLRHLPAAPDHAAAEPGPARSARYQSVHPAARRVRLGRAAGQHEHQSADADLAAADLGSDLGAAIARRRPSRSAATPQRFPMRPARRRHGASPRRRRRPARSPSPARSGRPPTPAPRRSTPERKPTAGTARAITASTWPDGNYTTRDQLPPAPAARPSPSRTQVQGTVSAVNVSQNPPPITVGGQNYPDQPIQAINSGSRSASQQSQQQHQQSQHQHQQSQPAL